MTRAQMLVWATLSGLVMGLIGGVLATAALVLVAQLTPLPARLVERLRVPVLVLLLAGAPLVGAVLGYLEGRAKLD
jgi:H+/Cl- antiporter ClcA